MVNISPEIPEIPYRCPCGGTAETCTLALLCENCLHTNCRRRASPPDIVAEEPDPKKAMKAKRRYAAYRRRHRSCFDCKFIKPLPIDVACTHPVMRNLVKKGEK